ncbi:hypothetical protein Clacol_004436 [Clathrus columnatus]|uniref:F-box domain-containing protein n=1 Tax=Clathrus columnatus TaxID=1419009 RepID=A0AAV5AE48_9AGAM|nr:hypothetical protein Clacol_004436 [Clathrus columnatus]
MNMSPLSNLPVEIIVRFLSFLSPKELALCARLSKRFLAIIRTTSILTYALELGKASLDETYFLNFRRIENSECSSSDLLAALRKREHGLSTFTWSERWDTLLKKKFNNLQVCGSVFTGGYAHKYDEWYHVDTIYVYDLHNVNDNGPTVTTLSLDAVYSGYAVDPGQDLLVLIGKFVVGDSGNNCFCTPISETEVLLVCCEEAGVPLLRYFTINTDSRRPEEADPRLEDDDTLSSLKLHNHVIFDLPFKNHPLSNRPSTWTASMIFSEASYTPKTFSPFVIESSTFVYPRHSGMVGIKFQNTQPTLFMNSSHEPGRLPYTFDIFIHLDSLRKLKNTFSSSPTASISCPIPTIPWEEWGPGITRILQDTYLGPWHSRTLRGYRFLAPDTSEYQMWEGLIKLDFKILDFNTNAWDPSTRDIIQGESEVLTCDGIKITSSLPYREIRMTSPRNYNKYRSNRFGIEAKSPFSILMGDVIVWLDENPPNDLHVFQF